MLPRTVLEIAHFFETTFLSSIGLGLALGFMQQVVGTGSLRRILQSLASVLFFVPQPFVIYFGTSSVALRLYQQAILSLWGFGLGILFLVQLMSGPRLAKMRNQLVIALGAIATMILGVYCGRNTIGDYVLRPDIIAGKVDGLITSPPIPGTYEVIIDHKVYNITLDLLSELRAGDYIYAEVGIASNTILAIHE
jgi:hypothetical protein